ncbi:DUF4347 domain-containing protein [Labrys okinawensis]|uniref:DUF4347 domain-containing protein n=1 Tax=Labrys okinawensis TaxID=346911 RepID=UPI0039BC3AEC
MIMMQQPSLAINSDDVPGPKYIMWRTRDAPRGSTAIWTANQIVVDNEAALSFKKSQLLNVIINCHGEPGALLVGGDGPDGGRITKDNVGHFSILKGLNIGTIWLVACNAAKGTSGKQLCQQLATVSGCQVVAADDYQDVGVWGTIRLLTSIHGQIDEFEGNVYSFTPVGGARIIDPEEDIYTIKV